MKNFTRVLCLLFFTFIFSIQSFSQTFDFETAVIDSGNDKIVTQTVDGVTMTITAPFSPILTNIGGYGGSTGVIYHAGSNGGTHTVSFSTPIDITSLRAFDAGAGQTADWTFVPTGGSNSTVVTNVPGGAGTTVALNWTGVSSFTIENGFNAWATFDTIAWEASTLGVGDFEFDTFKFYPNPAQDMIFVTSNLQDRNSKLEIYNIAGKSILTEKVIFGDNRVDISSLSSGLYFVSVSSKDTLETKKLIIK